MSENEIIIVMEVLEVVDGELMKEYQMGAREQFVKWGGSMLAIRGEMYEGEPAFGPLLVQKWPSEAAFRAWQESEDYQPLLKKRLAAVKERILIMPILKR